MPTGDVPLVALLAEEPVAHIVAPLPPDERVVTERYCVNFGAGPTQTVVQRVRCGEDDLGCVIAEVRGLVAEHGHRRAIWFVGPSSRPLNLLELLRQRGFVPTTTPPFEPQYAAMIMTEPPTPPADTSISARRIETLDEVIEGLRIDAAATGLPADELDALLEAAPDLFAAERRDGHLTFLAFDETGMPIGVATAFVSPLGLELAAASTLPNEDAGRRRGEDQPGPDRAVAVHLRRHSAACAGADVGSPRRSNLGADLVAAVVAWCS